MNRFVFGRGWVACDETNGETDDAGGAGGGAAAPSGDGEGEGDGTPAGGGGAGEDDGAGDAAGAAKEKPPADMKSAIDQALGYAGKPKEGEQGGDKKPAAQPAEKKPAAAGGEGKETETHHANGKPKKDAQGNELDAEGKITKKAEPAKLKTAAELDLKPEEKKALHAKTQARFGEVITTLKAHEGTIAKQTETIKTLTEARDAILGVLQETNTTQDELAFYLEFNALVKSGDAKKIEQALGVVEKQRLSLYQALGREPEGGGIDLLKDFPDLAKKVEDELITREDALEIANNRRANAAREEAAKRERDQQQSKTQTAEQQKAAAEKALGEIEAWTAELGKSDLDYKAKEDKLLGKLDGVLKSYPPDKWLATLKLLYEGIEIPKAPAPAGGHKPLRPSGAKPGAKAPSSMLEAINEGLGYAAGKG